LVIENLLSAIDSRVPSHAQLPITNFQSPARMPLLARHLDYG
jgi:hypothetical protein